MTQSSPPRTWPMLLVGGLVLAVVTVAALWGGGDADPDALPFELVAPTSVSTVADGGPSAVGAALDGNGTVAVPVEGEPTMVLFLAHWCSHCQREAPVVQDWLDAGGLPEGVQIRAVATSIDELQPNYPPSAWLAGEGWTVSTVIDDGSIAAAFELEGLPFWALVDADGRVVGTSSGEQTVEMLDAMAATLATTG